MRDLETAKDYLEEAVRCESIEKRMNFSDPARRLYTLDKEYFFAKAVELETRHA